ncbi:MAG: DNA polymerase III subunit alpha, partial [Planctomycetaceae bacterium]|nr:DNA polymerase III subunit alpha [Planctomycetaceae bacterium]
MSENKRPFVHLHCHSHYSLLDGASSIPRLVTRAKDHGMNALAITDHGNLHGALQFYQLAKKEGINPIIGYEAYVAPHSRLKKGGGKPGEKSYHLTLLCQNAIGFRNLVKMASSASLEGFYFKPRIDRELLEAHSEGIICLSGCVSSEFNQAILKHHGRGAEEILKQAGEVASWFHSIFDDRYFIEIMNNGVGIQETCLKASVELANAKGLPLVATSDCHYVDRDDAEAQDVMLCINTGRFRTDTNRMKMDGNEYYLRSQEQMYNKFPGLESAVARSQEIADSVDIQLELGKRHFPVYKIEDDTPPATLLRKICESGLKERYAGNDEMLPGGELSEVVQKRLDRELGVIERLGFENYFLIVWDFVRESRDRNIPATARGSGVGAIVCYATYMSHVCPIRYDLLFERFLDENRMEAPDIDIDFCKERRGEMIDYVKEKYGAANVAQIGTFGTLAAKAAIKDVG